MSAKSKGLDPAPKNFHDTQILSLVGTNADIAIPEDCDKIIFPGHEKVISDCWLTI